MVIQYSPKYQILASVIDSFRSKYKKIRGRSRKVLLAILFAQFPQVLFAGTYGEIELVDEMVQWETLQDRIDETYIDPNQPNKIFPLGTSSGSFLEDDKAFSSWYRVGQIYRIFSVHTSGSDPHKINLQISDGNGIVVDREYTWSTQEDCWQDRDNTNFCSGAGNSSSFTSELGFSINNQVGSYTFELLYNDVLVPTETKPFEIVGPEFVIEGSSTFSGSGGSSLSSPLRAKLTNYDNTPLESESVTFSMPTWTSQGFALYPTSDRSGAGQKTLVVTTDSNGIAEVFVKIGDPGLTVNVSANTSLVPNTTLNYQITSLDTEIPDLDHEDNLGENEDRERDPCSSVGDPINVITGNMFHKETDFKGNSAFPRQFTRYYNSQDSVSTSLGAKWRHTFDRSISFSKTGKGSSAIYYAKLKRQDGKAITFADSGSGYVTDPDNDYQIVKTGGSWELYTPKDTVETYNGSGRLTSISYVNGDVVTLSYHQGNLDYVSSNTSEKIEFGYNNQDQLTSVEFFAADQPQSASESRIWTYGYTNGNLTSVVNPDGTQKTYHYENADLSNALTGITDERGNRYSSWEYDSLGKAIASDHGFGAMRVDIDYGINGARVVTDSLGNQATYDAFAQLGQGKISGTTGPTCSTGDRSVASYDYDPVTNDVLSRTVDGTTTQWGNYDENGNPGFMIEAASTPSERRTDYTYDPRFQNKVTSITEPSVYAGGNKVTTLAYDDFGNLISRTVAGYTPSGSPVARTTTYEYNGPYHQLSRIDGPRTDVSDEYTFEYYPDDPDLYQYQGMLMRVTAPGGLILRDNLDYNALRQLISETRPNGLTVTYDWEPDTDRLAAVSESDGSVTRTTAWTYLPTGQVETMTPPDGSTLTFTYDEAYRLTRVTDNSGNYIEYTLDTEGNIKEEKTYNAGGSIRRSISRTFDVYNRLDAVNQANEVIDYDFAADGTLAKEVNGNDVETQYGYDDLKRLTATTLDATGANPSTAQSNVGYAFDTQDNLAAVTDPNNGQTVYQYDDLGNRVSRTSPDTGTSTYQYDTAGNRVQANDAKGQTFTFAYDALNRLTGVDGPGTEHDIGYSYDSCTNGEGRLCAVSRGNNTNNFAYNAFGDLLSKQQTVQSFSSSVSSTVGITYDIAGRLQSIQYPGSNMSVTYGYDGVGNVSQVTLNRNGQASTLLGTMAYEPFGPLKSVTLGNGINRSLSYDQAYRLTAINDPVYDTSITYDANGNILYQTRSDGNLDTGYDALDRLTGATSPSVNKTFGYDKNGNRTQLSDNGLVTNYGYQSQSNRLSYIGAENVGLDANGNTTSLRGMILAYSPDNRLTSVTNATEITQYGYNGAGERVIKLDSANQKTVYHYGLQGQLLAELTASGSLQKAYIYTNGQPVAFVDYSTNGSGELYYVHNDHLGTPQGLTNESGTVVWKASYEPFGLATVDDDPDLDGTMVEFNIRFPGQYFDSESGLHYNYFRDYDPGLGRYIQSDPIGILRDYSDPQFQVMIGVGFLEKTGFAAEALNHTYGYVGQKPLSWFDRQGLAEHKSNRRPSNREKHENANSRRNQDRGGERGDRNRRPPNKRPPGYKGPWPPGSSLIIIPFPPEVIDQILPGHIPSILPNGMQKDCV